MAKRSLVSPVNQSVTFIELFFDLVFVFAVTQITVLLHHALGESELDFEHISEALILFWLMWWSWQQFTWTLNAADTTHPLIEFVTLIATGIGFFMAIAIPEAFGDRALLFAVTYVLNRVIGLYLQVRISYERGTSSAVRGWAGASISGLIFVLIGGIVGGGAQIFLWAIAIALDLYASSAAAGGEFDLHVEHFAERHGLIVIIALGESLIVAAGGLADQKLTSELMWISIWAVTITGALWWSYFVKPKPTLEEAMEAIKGPAQAIFARDVYSFAHLTMIAGIISYTLTIEEAILHPDQSLSSESITLLVVGLLLFVGSTVIAMWRATRRFMSVRLLLVVAGSIFIFLELVSISPLLISAVLLILIFVIEHNLPNSSGHDAHIA